VTSARVALDEKQQRPKRLTRFSSKAAWLRVAVMSDATRRPRSFWRRFEKGSNKWLWNGVWAVVAGLAGIHDAGWYAAIAVPIAAGCFYEWWMEGKGRPLGP